MDFLFNRVYRLTIGKNVKSIGATQPSESIIPTIARVERNVDPSSTGYSDFLVEPSDSLSITDLRIKASIVATKTGNTDKQQTTIEIFNLTKRNQEFIKANDTVILRAGYGDNANNAPVIFVGQIVQVSTTKKQQDTVTKIVCSSSEVPRKNVRISKLPLENETSRTIAEYLASVAASNGIPTGNIFVPVELPYPFGFPAYGYLFPILEEFCSNNNLRCYLSLGKLYIEPIDTIQFIDVVKITEDNIKESIRPQQDSGGKPTTEPTDAKRGIEFNTFLDGRITTAKKIEVTYGEYTGDYKITSLEFKLDLEGKSWDTVVTADRIG